MLEKECWNCDGKGKVEDYCLECNGRGTQYPSMGGSPPCTSCKGEWDTKLIGCDECHGSGSTDISIQNTYRIATLEVLVKELIGKK